MPYDRISAMGVQHGLLTPVDEANMEAARQQAAMKLQQYMADQAQSGQNDAAQIAADASKYATQAQFASQGSFADRAAQESEMERLRGDRSMGIVQAQMGPANMAAQLERQKYQDASGLENMKRQAQMSILGRIMPGAGVQAGSPAVGGLSGIGSDDQRQQMMDMYAIMNGQTPQDPVIRQLQRSQLLRQDAQSRITGALAGGNEAGAAQIAAQSGETVPMADYQAIASAVQPEIQRVKDFIRANNWSIAGNLPQLKTLHDQVMAKIKALRGSPQAQQLLETDLKNAMRDALQENGAIFKSYGTSDVEQGYGL